MNPRSAIAAAVLLDQSADMAAFDPTGLRFEAVTSYFESVTPPDAVTLGTYQGVPSTAVLTTYGDFTSDTEGLRTAVNALAGQERGTNPLYTAITDMIAYTATHAPSGSNERQRSVVAVSTEPTVGGDACTHLESCRRAMLAAAEAGRAAGVALVSIGRGYAPPACEIAKRTGWCMRPGRGPGAAARGVSRARRHRGAQSGVQPRASDPRSATRRVRAGTHGGRLPGSPGWSGHDHHVVGDHTDLMAGAGGAGAGVTAELVPVLRFRHRNRNTGTF